MMMLPEPTEVMPTRNPPNSPITSSTTASSPRSSSAFPATAAAAERIEDDVARPRIASDERVGEGCRKARQVRAHRVKRVAPQPLLVLPLGRQGDGREFERKLEGFACFETERRDYPHPRSERALRAHAEFFGASAGCEYAEPFVLVRNVE